MSISGVSVERLEAQYEGIDPVGPGVQTGHRQR
jgi:hypothetical protein